METRSSPPPPSPCPPPSPLGPLHLPARGLQACLQAHLRNPGLPKHLRFGSLPTQSRSLLQGFPRSAPLTSSTPMMSRRRKMWMGMMMMAATSYKVVKSRSNMGLCFVISCQKKSFFVVSNLIWMTKPPFFTLSRKHWQSHHNCNPTWQESPDFRMRRKVAVLEKAGW